MTTESQQRKLRVSREFAEKLFRKLEGLTERFEVKLMMLELVSRLISTSNKFSHLLHSKPYVEAVC